MFRQCFKIRISAKHCRVTSRCRVDADAEHTVKLEYLSLDVSLTMSIFIVSLNLVTGSLTALHDMLDLLLHHCLQAVMLYDYYVHCFSFIPDKYFKTLYDNLG